MISLALLAQYLAWPLIMVAAMIFDSLFSGLETGTYVMNKVRLDLHAEAGRRPAVTLKRMLADARNLLAVLLIGTNVCRYTSTFAITAMFALAGYAENAELLTTAVATPLLFVLTESVPKVVFQRLGAAAVYRFTWLLRAADTLFRLTGVSLLVRAVGGALMRLTRESRSGEGTFATPHLAAIVAEGQASGTLTHFQSVMADRVARLSEVTLRDVMVPMREAATAPPDVTREQLMRLIAQHNYSRVPLLDDRRQVVGILDVYEVLIAEGAGAPADRMRPPLALPSELNVTDALYRMQRKGEVMAVVESGGRHVGLATMKDLVEEIVGDLQAW